MPRPGPLALTALLLAGGTLSPPPPAALADQDEGGGRRRFEDSLVVREVEVRFDMSVLPPLESIGRRGARDFVLIEEGAARPTLRFDAEPDRGGWEILIWLDDGLADGGALAVGARALAGRAAELTAAGAVELVEAGETLARHPPTDSAGELAGRLLRIAQAHDRGPARGGLDPARALSSLDRLAIEIAARTGGGARLLLLPVSTWQVDAPLLDELGRARSGAPPGARARPLTEAARTLAGYGWITFGLALRPDAEPTSMRGPKSEATPSTGPGGEQRTFAPIFRFPWQRVRPTASEQTRLDTAVDLGLIPNGDLVRPGSGAVAGHAEQLDELLERVFARARLIAAAPESLPGQMLTRRLLWIGGDGRPLPALTVARSSTPPEVAAARLRRALAGASSGGLDPRFVLDRRAGAPRVCLADGVARGWVRLSSARPERDAPALAIGAPVELRRPGAGTTGPSADAAPACASWPESSAADAVRLVEDLDRESWTTF